MRKVSVVISLVVLLSFLGTFSCSAKIEGTLEPVAPKTVEKESQYYDAGTLFRYIEGKQAPLLPFLSFEELVVEVESKVDLIEIGKLLTPLGFTWEKDLFFDEWIKEVSTSEEAKIQLWIKKNGLNEYGDPKDTEYGRPSPLYDPATKEWISLNEYLLENHPDRPWLNRFSLWKRPIELKDLTKEKYIKLIEEILEVLNKVRNSGEAINTYPVFHFPEGAQIPTGEFVVHFRSEIAGIFSWHVEEYIRENKVKVVEKDEEKRIFLLKIDKDSSKNVFAMANSFHEDTITVSSYPLFRKISLPVEAKIRVVPNGVTIRETFQYIIEIEKDKEIILEETYFRKGSPNVEALMPEGLNPQLWEIKAVEISEPELISKTREKVKVVYTISISQPGQFFLPHLTIYYKVEGWDGQPRIKKAEFFNLVPVKVASFLPEGVFDINDIKLPEIVLEFPGKLASIVLLIVGLAALAVVMVALCRLNLVKPEPEKKKKAETSFHEKALEKLDELKESTDPLDFKDTEKRSRFFVKLLDLVKETLEKKFHLNLTSISFEGLGEQLREVGVTPEIIELTQRLLELGEREIYSPVSEFDKKDLDGILANVETLILAVTEEENDPPGEGEDDETN